MACAHLHQIPVIKGRVNILANFEMGSWLLQKTKNWHDLCEKEAGYGGRVRVRLERVCLCNVLRERGWVCMCVCVCSMQLFVCENCLSDLVLRLHTLFYPFFPSDAYTHTMYTHTHARTHTHFLKCTCSLRTRVGRSAICSLRAVTTL